MHRPIRLKARRSKDRGCVEPILEISEAPHE